MAKEADHMNVIASSAVTSAASSIGRVCIFSNTNFIAYDQSAPLKSFRVTSEVLRSWPLKDGENDLTFIADADERCVVKCKL